MLFVELVTAAGITVCMSHCFSCLEVRLSSTPGRSSSEVNSKVASACRSSVRLVRARGVSFEMARGQMTALVLPMDQRDLCEALHARCFQARLAHLAAGKVQSQAFFFGITILS